jgi:hypothetical protein
MTDEKGLKPSVGMTKKQEEPGALVAGQIYSNQRGAS